MNEPQYDLDADVKWLEEQRENARVQREHAELCVAAGSQSSKAIVRKWQHEEARYRRIAKALRGS